jgi:hypothetical protein
MHFVGFVESTNVVDNKITTSGRNLPVNVMYGFRVFNEVLRSDFAYSSIHNLVMVYSNNIPRIFSKLF